MNSAYAELEERNRELSARIAELQSEHFSFELFKKQINQQIQYIKQTRNGIEQNVSESSAQSDRSKRFFEETIKIKDNEIVRLKEQLNFQKQQIQTQNEKIKYLSEKLKSTEQQLLNKTTILSNYLKTAQKQKITLN